MKDYHFQLQKGCSCKDVEIGTYDNQIELKTPDFMLGMGKIGCLKFRDTTCVDECIGWKILGLWKLGIITTGCCCGHNKDSGYIGIHGTEEQIKQASRYLFPKNIKINDSKIINRSGYDRLWGWFSLSYASFLTIPRVLMHEMPDDWQNRMAALLEEYENTYPNQPDIGTQVQATKNGKLTKMPEFLKNYRYPDRESIEKMKSFDSTLVSTSDKNVT